MNIRWLIRVKITILDSFNHALKINLFSKVSHISQLPLQYFLTQIHNDFENNRQRSIYFRIFFRNIMWKFPQNQVIQNLTLNQILMSRNEKDISLVIICIHLRNLRNRLRNWIGIVFIGILNVWFGWKNELQTFYLTHSHSSQISAYTPEVNNLYSSKTISHSSHMDTLFFWWPLTMVANEVYKKIEILCFLKKLGISTLSQNFEEERIFFWRIKEFVRFRRPWAIYLEPYSKILIKTLFESLPNNNAPS